MILGKGRTQDCFNREESMDWFGLLVCERFEEISRDSAPRWSAVWSKCSIPLGDWPQI